MPAARPRGSTSSALQLPPLSELPSHLISTAYKALDAFQSLSPRAKLVAGIIALCYATFILIVIRVGPHGILEWLAQFSTFFAQSTFGPLIIILLITILSFPPTFGYGTVITLCGLSFGSPLAAEGNSVTYAWLVASTGCLVGSLTAFLGCRYALDTHGADWSWVRKVRQGKEWKAMERAVERKGWKMILLVRLCPFPFVYSNLFFASLRSGVVPVPLFILATLATTPKLFIHVFIGAQTYEAIRSGGEGGAGGNTGWLRLFYIVAASGLGAATSWYIYHETKKALESFADEDEVEEGLVGSEEREEEPASWGWSDDEEGEQRVSRGERPPVPPRPDSRRSGVGGGEASHRSSPIPRGDRRLD